MTNRREFLQIGITATAWPLATGAAQATGIDIDAVPLMPLYKIVFDDRFSDSVAFAGHASTMGVDTHAISGDMTQFWYDELYHVWRQQAVAIAGLTAHGPMFCFEQLGREHGLRIVFEAEHRPSTAGSMEHSLSGPQVMLERSMALVGETDAWARCMADVVSQCPRGRAEITSQALRGPARKSEFGFDTDALYSWVIAPAIKS